ncbi:MAG: hypothetical protein U0175_12830 [Caldilineaceae bacterium]
MIGYSSPCRYSVLFTIALFVAWLAIALTSNPVQAASDTFNCPGARGGISSFPIQGIKWHDINGNQLQDKDEPGLPGITIEAIGQMSNGAQVITRTVTNDKGEFCIGGPVLVDGIYQVKEVLSQGQLAEWEQTFPPSGVYSVTVGPNTPFITFGNKQKADLVIDKARITNPVYYGQPISYSLTVNNLGPGLATGPITVTDVITNSPLLTLPISVTAPAPWNCMVLGGGIRCIHPGPLPASSALPQITITATVVTTPPQPQQPLRNCATVRPLADKNPQNNEDCDVTDQIQFPTKLPDLSLTKEASPTVFIIGQPAYWVINVSNLGPGSTLGPIFVTDTVPALFTILGATGSGWNCTVVGQQVTCAHPGPMAAGNSLPPILIHVVPGSGVTQIENCAETNTKGDPKSENNRNCATVEIKSDQKPPPDVTVRKQISGSVTSPGSATFSVTVINIGSGPTTGPIFMTDTLPAYLTPITANAPAPWSCSMSGQMVSCTHPGPVPPGNSLPTIVITANVASGVAQLANCALVNTTGDVKPNNNQGCVETILNPGKPDLGVRKAISTSLTAGGTGIFSITVKNLGTGVATGPITVTDTLIPALTPISVTAAPPWNCSSSGQTVGCVHPGALAPGATLPPIFITVNVAAGISGFENCAKVAVNGDGKLNNNQHCIGGQVIEQGKPDLELDKKPEGEIINGTPGSFLLTVSNVGSAAASGPITVTDILPPGLTPTSANAPAPWSCTIGGQTVTCVHPGPLAAGASLPTIQLFVTVKIHDGQNLVNCAKVSGVGDSNLFNNRDCVNVLADSDHDLVADTIECPNGIAVCPDRDLDGLTDYLDDDDDGDGIPTANEINEDGSAVDSDSDAIPDAQDNCTLKDAGGSKCKEDVYVWKIKPRNGSPIQQGSDGNVQAGGCISCGVSISNIAIDERGVHRMRGLALDLNLPGVGDESPGVGYTILLEADVDGDGEFEPLGTIQLLGDGSVRSTFGEALLLHIEVWQNGQKIGEFDLKAGDLGKLVGAGSQISFQGLPPGSSSAGMSLHFAANFDFTPSGQLVSAATLTGDELRIRAVNPTLVADGIDQVTVTTDGTESFTIQGVGEISGGTSVYLPLVVR